MFEAEIKLEIEDPESVRAELDRYASGINENYYDCYFAHPAIVPLDSEREFRLRRIQSADDDYSVLTFKDWIVDEGTHSKREYEVRVDSAVVLKDMLLTMGFTVDIEFRKLCVNWRFSYEGYKVVTTLVEVPEIAGTFLEVEVLVEERDQVDAAISALRRLSGELGLKRSDETLTKYTDGVRESRRKGSA